MKTIKLLKNGNYSGLLSRVVFLCGFCIKIPSSVCAKLIAFFVICVYLVTMKDIVQNSYKKRYYYKVKKSINILFIECSQVNDKMVKY